MVIRENTPIAYKEFIRYLNKIFSLSMNDIRNIIKDFHSEMYKGLSGFESSLKMIPSFTDRAKGTEKGKFIAVDLGGTNFRVISVELDGKGEFSVSAVNKYVIDKQYMEGSGEQLFNFIANGIKSFMEWNNISFNKKLELAFTFSFPVEQTNIAAGKLLTWTKGFSASNVVGEDIVVMLNEALRRIGIKNLKVAALVNDTVGTLVAKSYTEPSCDVGVILGTGTNACYPEKMANIKKWRGISPKETMIINIEWGNFDKLPITVYDKVVDAASLNPGCQRLEKMVSGMFLGEILRVLVRDLIKRDLIFQDKSAVNAFSRHSSLKTKEMDLIEADTSNNLGDVEAFLAKVGIKNVTLESKKLFKHIGKLIASRSAKLAAASIAAVVLWMDPEIKNSHTIGIDGSLFEKYPGYKKMMKNVFKSLFKKDAKHIVLESTKDGSGVGAAIIAAIATSTEG
jgi:hexokinase